MRSEVTLADPDSDSDNFSVEFEVESIASDDYNEDDASVSADDQVSAFSSQTPNSYFQKRHGVIYFYVFPSIFINSVTG